MFQKLKELLGLDPIKNQSDAYTRRVADINKLESEYEKLSDEALAAKTKGDKFNPHDSHMGRVECTACHSMHKKSQFICRDCHAIPSRKFKGE